ncbi:hypothetical protein [Acinetobacter modestus]|uniref:Uncharacterized protein n=1 Tax=Acinetobacter modestus TaxID=1776740 RepID=A0ABN0JMG7_9GAMM|nr:hypothetical protein [Acinetobacter modestus]ENU26466.1 hypothetical protein F992_02014 [Acinetobacter modestus]GGA09075.1 hypothetical protein GCM10017554_00940 [Acinetobacter modestus]
MTAFTIMKMSMQEEDYPPSLAVEAFRNAFKQASLRLWYCEKSSFLGTIVEMVKLVSLKIYQYLIRPKKNKPLYVLMRQIW